MSLKRFRFPCRESQNLFRTHQKKKKLLDQISKDVDFLEALKIMDYSLLLGIHDADKADNITDIEKRRSLPPQFSPTTSPSPISDDSTPIRVRSRSKTGTQPPKFNPATMLPAISEIGPIPPNRLMSSIPFYEEDEGGLRCKSEDGKKHELYFLGIIDIFTTYNTKKQLEHTYKMIKYEDKEGISCVSARRYAARFRTFLESIIV